MLSRTCLIALLLAASATIAAFATTNRVPDQYPTIQSGIDAASVGDTVLVACGTYYEHNIVMKSDISLISETGQADCVTIDAQVLGRVLYCEGIGENTLIRGFTLTRGHAGISPGGGIYCGGYSSPTFESCVIRDNSGGSGGGMFCSSYSSPVLNGVTFERNVGLGTHPGGGGLACFSSPILTDCAFIGNLATTGAGMVCFSGSPILERVLFDGNDDSSLHGATVHFEGGTVTLRDVLLSGNSGGYAWGALYLDTCTEATLMRVTIVGNSSGAAHFLGCSPTVTSCTLYGNDGCLNCTQGASPTLEQSIIAFSVYGPGIRCNDPSSQPVLECCDIFGNEGGDWVGCIEDQYGVNGNISEDPLFCDPENGDLTLQEDSPCAPFSPPNQECDLIGAWPVGCGPPTASRERTWGQIKASYRE